MSKKTIKEILKEQEEKSESVIMPPTFHPSESNHDKHISMIKQIKKYDPELYNKMMSWD
jgi:hypothetical protein